MQVTSRHGDTRGVLFALSLATLINHFPEAGLEVIYA